ncbi:MAG: polysaccharide biosynthesis protein [Chitinophagaceae bacterium]|nr:MAG: polysaccharide biosynthesis protein [Chitinophagaceae bacterium]
MKFKDKRLISGRVLVILDLFLSLGSILMAYALRFNFQIPENTWAGLIYVLPIVLVLRFFSFVLFRTYAGLIRYTSTEDATRIFFANTAITLVFSIINLLSYQLNGSFLIPYSVIIIDYILINFLSMGFRLSVKLLYLEFSGRNKQQENVLIYGAGEAGVITKRTLEQDPKIDYKIIAFLDDNPHITNNKLEGITILRTDDALESLLEEEEINLLILTTYNLSAEKKQFVANSCLKHKTRVLSVPPMSSWINGELSFKQIKKLNIEELLERDPIQLDIQNIKSQIQGKSILITGAAGSIGNEIVRQILPFKPAEIILIDKAESPLYELELEVNQHNLINTKPYIFLADICNKEKIEALFKRFKPDFIFHAAAYKHVPVMESHPDEAIRVNLMGTKTLADLAIKYEVKKFVFVSTDKAVNPTNVMGASKRAAEIYVQSLNQSNNNQTRFITTRFGNVLGSNGSVIQLFKKQIEKGGPVTVTHPEVTRFFMTIPEACQLVLEAGAMGKGGEIFIFDMGQSVKVVDLAKKMVRLSGLELGKDINLVYTGLRPGEKLYEELLNNKENTAPTHNQKILILQVKEYELAEVRVKVDKIISDIDLKTDMENVLNLKNLIPEYKSMQSKFEELDAKEDGKE